MIIIPELQTVVILVPRTGTGSLRNAILATYPKAFMPYRHMEADGVPLGYDRWRKIGVVRHPTDRLFSLYKYCNFIGGEEDPVSGRFRDGYCAKLRESVEFSDFSNWILDNDVPFTHPYEFGGDKFYPFYNQLHSYPENHKSQFLYLRPDLGTEIYRFEDELPRLWAELVLPTVEREHVTPQWDKPNLSLPASTHLERVMSWDFKVSRGF